MCYSALWFFPVLIVVGGLTTSVWDVKLQRIVGKAKSRWLQRRRDRDRPVAESATEDQGAEHAEVISLPAVAARDERATEEGLQRRHAAASTAVPRMSEASNTREGTEPSQVEHSSITQPTARESPHHHTISVRTGCIIIAAFFGMLVIHSTLVRLH
jgi:hypothetical protein